MQNQSPVFVQVHTVHPSFSRRGVSKPVRLLVVRASRVICTWCWNARHLTIFKACAIITEKYSFQYECFVSFEESISMLASKFRSHCLTFYVRTSHGSSHATSTRVAPISLWKDTADGINSSVIHTVSPPLDGSKIKR